MPQLYFDEAQMAVPGPEFSIFVYSLAFAADSVALLVAPAVASVDLRRDSPIRSEFLNFLISWVDLLVAPTPVLEDSPLVSVVVLTVSTVPEAFLPLICMSWCAV